MFDFDKTLIVPRGTPGLAELRIDLTEINYAQSRSKELAYVNKETAHELMHTFDKAADITNKLLLQVLSEYEQAITNTNKRKAIVILDVAPEELKKRNLITARSPAGSEDLRNAILDCDEEYLKLQEVLNTLKVTYRYLKGKLEMFERNYYAAKKSLDLEKSIGRNVHDLRNEDNSDIIGEPNF